MRIRVQSFFILLIVCSVIRAQPLADKVPDDAILYIGWSGSNNLGDAYAQSHLKAVLDNSKIRQLFTEFLPQARQKLVENEPDAEEPTRIMMGLAAPMWKYPTAIFASVDLSNPEEPMPKVGIVCRAGKDSPELHKQFEALLAEAGETSVPIRSFEQDDLVAFVIGYDEAQSPLAGAGGKGAIGQAAGFVNALKHVQADPRLIVYVNIEKLVADAEQAVLKTDEEEVKQMVPKILDASGLRGLKRAIATSNFDGKDWMSMSFIEAPAPRTGLLGVLDNKPVSPDLLKAIPPDATFVATGRFDAAKFIQELRTAAGNVDPRGPQFIDMGLGAVQMALAKNPVSDILEPMGQDWAIYCSPTVSGNGVAGVVIVNRLDDPTKAKNALPAATINFSNWIAVALAQSEAEVEIRARNVKIGEQTIYYMGLPIVAPSWTINGDYLYLALFPQVAAAGARAGAREDKSFAENEKFQGVLKRLDVKDPIAVSFYDLPAVTSTGSMYQQLLVGFRWAGFGDLFGIPVPEPLMPPLDVLMQHMAPAGSATWVDDAGIHTKSISPFPGSKLFSEPGLFTSGAGPVSGVAILAGAVAPAIEASASRETDDRAQCAANMRALGQAIIIYANDNQGNYPPDLGALLMAQDATAPLFVCPGSSTDVPDTQNMTPEQIAEWVTANSDFVYVGQGQTNQAGADVIILYEKPEDHDFAGINVLYGDVHVEFKALPEAIEELQKQGVKLDMPPNIKRK